jgi:hypothetical protein
VRVDLQADYTVSALSGPIVGLPEAAGLGGGGDCGSSFGVAIETTAHRLTAATVTGVFTPCIG